MARDDLKLIIEAERKTAATRIDQIHRLYGEELKARDKALEEVYKAHDKYRRRRNTADWIWTVVFVAVAGFVVLVLA